MENLENFGVLLDCSRNAVIKPEQVKQLILIMEKLGFNLLQLYTEDTYEIEGEPYFGHLRGRYSKAELKEIDSFAMKHGVELMPCIQTLSHLEKIFEWDCYKDINDIENILLAGEEKTYSLIDKMLSTCAECFTSRKINIGFDEAHYLGLGRYLERNGYERKFSIFIKHLNKVYSVCQKYRFKPLIWSDMIFKILFNEYYCRHGVFSDEVKKSLPSDISLAYWDYFSMDKEIYRDMIDRHRELGREIWFAGSAVKFCGFHSANAISIDRLGKSISVCKEKGIKNILITLWGNGGNECSYSAVLPALTYASQAVRGEFDESVAKKEFKRIFDEEWDSFMLCDMNTELKRQDDIGMGAKEMLYSDYFCGRLNNLVSDDGRERRHFAKYSELFHKAAVKSKNYRYLFEFYKALCDVLSVKYDLGFLTRKYYQNREMSKLKNLLADYGKTARLIKKLIEKFRILWFTENKPNGFEVHEIRLGGVLQRTLSCKKRLREFLCGKIAVIGELEERLPYSDGDKYLPDRNDYKFVATVNTL